MTPPVLPAASPRPQSICLLVRALPACLCPDPIDMGDPRLPACQPNFPHWNTPGEDPHSRPQRATQDREQLGPTWGALWGPWPLLTASSEPSLTSTKCPALRQQSNLDGLGGKDCDTDQRLGVKGKGARDQSRRGGRGRDATKRALGCSPRRRVLGGGAGNTVLSPSTHT